MLKVMSRKDYEQEKVPLDASVIEGKRHLTQEEIAVLEGNGNNCDDWNSVYVSSDPDGFDPRFVSKCTLSGYIVIGRLGDNVISYHDLSLSTGIYFSTLEDVVVGDDCAIKNVRQLKNYRLGNRVILFNIQEMSCTYHSKFGEGLLMEGEDESSRIWIGVGNENENRAVLPFKDMIPADAYLWSRYREDRQLMDRFRELTEHGHSRKNDKFGIIEDDVVIKNSLLLKDVRVYPGAYIKGALKLKNITVLSSEREPSQIGEGVELVNGILGYGSKVFYQAVAVRFVIGRNCQLKYGARLLNSVLGDNSTVSCCELLNNLIFPFHEQHHNSSFLIASTIMGQSNIASAATIGSNHNSRSPDCEMVAGRGFWPGLCSDFKFDSKFASFVLAAKGSYNNELNVTYPFSLIAPCPKDGTVHIIPAYWFLYNMFAIVRNKYKFSSRDRRVVKVQHIETNPLAPDTVQEIITSIDRLIHLTSSYLKLSKDEVDRYTQYNSRPELLDECRRKSNSATTKEELYYIAKDYLHQNSTSKFILVDDRCQRKFGALIYKPAQSYKEYRRVLKYFCIESLMAYVLEHNKESLTFDDVEELEKKPLYTEWENCGGQVIPRKKVEELFDLVKNHGIDDWNQVHEFYDRCQENYVEYKARYALYILEKLYSKKILDFTETDYEKLLNDVAFVSMNMLESSIAVREKDYTDFFRSVTYRNQDEKNAVLGTLDGDGFLKKLRAATDDFEANLDKLFKNLRK